MKHQTADNCTSKTHDTEVVKDMCENWTVSFCKVFGQGGYLFSVIDIKNSLIIHEENTKKNHKCVVSVYVIQIHVDLHKL
jgi:hypothetical protein